ncbi:MAG: DUF4157 domain-containing protein, partial [Bacteroidales bacterium]|nr:DUF4157 domain-containing protein [Bacteroidales bacterium]
MKSQIDKSQEQSNNIVPKVQQETSTGGNTLLTDNRSSIVYQRKLRANMTASSNMESFAQGMENRTGIPNKLKTGFENISGYSMDDVKVHYNSPKPAQLQALAYTQGSNVYIGPRQEKHLAHELGHVLQQKINTVPVTNKLNGVNLNTDLRLEHQADIFAKQATAASNLNGALTGSNFYNKTTSALEVVQRKENTPTDYKDFAALNTLTLKQLNEYSQRQADWHVSPKLSDEERGLIHESLRFIQSEDYITSSCENFNTGEFIEAMAQMNENQLQLALSQYSLLAAKSDPFLLSSSSLLKLDEALWIGKKIIELKNIFPYFV